MSARLATRCPNCRTAFRVTPDQLAAMGGQVRCGRCSFIFNAVDHLLPPATEGVTQMPTIVTPQAPAALRTPPPAPEARQAHEEPRPAPAKPSPADLAPVTPAPALPANLPVKAAASPDTTFDLANLLMPPPKSRMRWLWGALSLPLLALVLLQGAWLLREPLYKSWPTSRTWWPPLCERLGCTPPLLRDKQALLVDNVALEELSTSPHVVRWTADLHNTADYPVALPHLELTLTDVHDQAVVRKVFTPADYAPGASGTLTAGNTLSVRRVLGLSVAGASGYRVLAFYP